MGAHSVRVTKPALLLEYQSVLSGLSFDGYPLFVGISGSSNPCDISRLDGANGTKYAVCNIWTSSINSFKGGAKRVTTTYTIRLFYPVPRDVGVGADLAYSQFTSMTEACVEKFLELTRNSIDDLDMAISMADSIFGNCDTWISTITFSVSGIHC
jgi:hypothetical protein